MTAGGSAKRVTRSSVVSDHIHEAKPAKKSKIESSSDFSRDADEAPQYANISLQMERFVSSRVRCEK